MTKAYFDFALKMYKMYLTLEGKVKRISNITFDKEVMEAYDLSEEVKEDLWYAFSIGEMDDMISKFLINNNIVDEVDYIKVFDINFDELGSMDLYIDGELFHIFVSTDDKKVHGFRYDEVIDGSDYDNKKKEIIQMLYGEKE